MLWEPGQDLVCVGEGITPSQAQPLSLSHGSPWELEYCAPISWGGKLTSRETPYLSQAHTAS